MQRGFDTAEFQTRTAKAQAKMADAGLDALLLTTEQDLYYFSGYLTRFWQSPCRPWFMVIPATGNPIAVIPSIGEVLMGQTWITDIRTWRAPDLADDGVSLLTEALRGCGSRIGTPMGIQSMLRMPLADWQRLNAALPQPIESDAGIIRDLRLIKSQAEIAKIKHTCGIAERAFARVPSIAQEGVPLDRVYRDFQSLCLDEGADWVPYLAGASQQGGYGDVISPADDTPLAHGDVLMLDTGSIWDGYFCDYDRNFAVGDVSQQVDDAHSKLIDATLAAFDIAKPGITASDLFHVMDQICTGGAGGNGAGRNGHGLGMNLTEWPSFIPTDKTMLAPGMVLTLEPSIETPDGQTLVAEENIAITETGAMWLSTLAPRKMVRI